MTDVNVASVPSADSPEAILAGYQQRYNELCTQLGELEYRLDVQARQADAYKAEMLDINQKGHDLQKQINAAAGATPAPQPTPASVKKKKKKIVRGK